MGATEYPNALRRREIEADVMPLPMPEMTPPEMKIYLRALTEVEYAV